MYENKSYNILLKCVKESLPKIFLKIDLLEIKEKLLKKFKKIEK
jgi:hypothetical protein